MSKIISFSLMLALLSNIGFAKTIHVSLLKDSSGKRIIKSRIYGEIPEFGIATTELTFPGISSKDSDKEVCNQFLVPLIKKTVLYPKSLNPECKIRAFNMSAFQCPKGTLSTVIVVEGAHCDETIELFETSTIHLVGSVTPEAGSDIFGVDFVLR